MHDVLQDLGELCFEGDQCKTGCCLWDHYPDYGRCLDKSPESYACQSDVRGSNKFVFQLLRSFQLDFTNQLQ